MIEKMTVLFFYSVFEEGYKANFVQIANSILILKVDVGKRTNTPPRSCPHISVFT